MTSIRLTTLDNGLRIVTDAVPHVESVALGIWIGAGARDEDLKYNGAAHMVEHMLFKGTKRRNSQDIAETLENVGGRMNAYTAREVTSYHAHVLKGDVLLALDLLSDMVLNSTLPDEEIERERDVILQEIGMTHDAPDDLVFDEYYRIAYPNQGVGAPILGTVEIISGMTRDALQDFIRTFYTPSRLVVSAAGNLDHDQFVEQVKEIFGDLPEDKDDYERQAAFYGGGNLSLTKDLEQMHFVLGFQGLNRFHEEHYNANALSIVLGGGMSSRLFQEIREKRGLVYSIFSFNAALNDTGQFGIYAGTGPEKMTEILPVICDELLAATHQLKDEEINRAKVQMTSGLLMSQESMMSRADRQAKHVIYWNEAYDPAESIRKIKQVNKASVESVAAQVFQTPHTYISIVPESGDVYIRDDLEKRLSA